MLNCVLLFEVPRAVDSSVHRILQAIILRWVAISYSREASLRRDGTCVCCISCTGRRIFYHEHHLGSPRVKVLVAQSCLSLGDPMECSLLGPSVRGILQARIPEWIALPFCRGSSQPRDRTWVSCTAGRFFTIWTTQGPRGQYQKKLAKELKTVVSGSWNLVWGRGYSIWSLVIMKPSRYNLPNGASTGNSGWKQDAHHLAVNSCSRPERCALRRLRMRQHRILTPGNWDVDQRKDFSEPRLLNLPIHRKALNS